MASRHQLDQATRLPRGKLPATKEIERADADEGDLQPGPFPLEVVEAEPYLVDPALGEAVDIAITLGRPLLLQGDPGCGKTRLAHYVAYALGLPLEEAYVKSTTRAQDLLYTFDAVGRLYDAQLPVDTAGRDRQSRSLDPARYVRLGPFGRAIARAHAGRRSVVLIDEVDKADLDFPNDLLWEIDRLEFVIPETGQRWSAPRDRPELRPIVFITHNEEKQLPPAFLRRCVYHWLTFPHEEEFLEQVLALHGVADVALAERAVEMMTRLRSGDLSRKPGISELLDWALVLQARKVPPAAVSELPAVGALVKAPLDQQRARGIVAP